MAVLTAEQVKKFKDDGSKTTFETEEQGKHVGDDYFLSSSSKISFFLEPAAVSNETPRRLVVPKHESVNKIGHALAQLDEVFHRYTLREQRLKDIAREIGVHEDPMVLQSMIICKQPRIGGKDPPSAVGFWIALEDVTPENGALSFLPGSHLRSPLNSRFVRMSAAPEGPGGTGFIPWPKNGPTRESIEWEKEEGWFQATCKKGSLVLIDGLVQHQSPHNHSGATRYIYTFHMIEGAVDPTTGKPKKVYDDLNWLQPDPSLPFPRLFDDHSKTIP